MARIPDRVIARLKREVSIERLVEASGVKLEHHGKDLIGLCPFHDDREPSLVVSPGKNLWHCLGACGEGGSVIDWVMKRRGVGFREAVELLGGDAGMRLNEGARKGGASDAEGANAARGIDPGADREELLRQVVSFYHRTLLATPSALGYLKRRAIGSGEALDRFRLGYADRRAGLGLPHRGTKEGVEVRDRLKELGILHPKTGQELFGGSITIPIFDASGSKVVGLYGRKVRDDVNPPFHRYLAGPHRGLWNLAALREHREVILCESLIDALTFWCAGFRNVTAAYGTNGFTDAHRESFAAYGIRRVLIAYDRDPAGDGAAEKLAAELGKAGVECFRVQFPKGMDANDYALSVQPAAKGLGLAIRHAAWLGAGPAPTGTPTAGKTAGQAAGSAAVPSPEPAGAGEQQAAKEEAASSFAARAAKAGPPAGEAAPAAASDAPEPAAERSSTSKPPAASPVPPAPGADVAAEVRGEEVVIPLGDRRYRVRGLAKNLAYDVLKVNLLVSRSGEGADGYHVDTFDLYSARHRGSFQKLAAVELALQEEVIKKDLGKVLLALEELQDRQIQEALAPAEEPAVTLTAAECEEALELLRDPDLLERLLADFAACGIVGEETNLLVGYLAAVSRKTDEPLAVIVQSSSAAGKTSLMEAILAMMPPEERVKYSAMTGQSLFYMGETDLSHKILAIVEEEGAERASYALKLLQSEHELSIASTGKDPTTGRLVTHEYRVEGPVMIFLTTTAIDLDEELENRCLVLTVDESREQTRAIHEIQRRRRTLAGIEAKSRRGRILARHQNAQRLLAPVAVRNRYAPRLTFLDTQTRTRRDHEKYLTLIDAIALLHQHQREIHQVKGEGGEEIAVVDVELADVAAANRLAHRVLGWSLDELPPQTRRLLGLVTAMVEADCERLGMDVSDYRFTRRQVREATGWGNTQLKHHLKRLEEMEYLVVHQGGRGLTYVYELLDGVATDEERVLPGLIDVAELASVVEKKSAPAANKSGSAPKKSGSEAEKSGPSRGQVGPKSGGGQQSLLPVDSGDCGENEADSGETARPGAKKAAARHRQARRRPGDPELVGTSAPTGAGASR